MAELLVLNVYHGGHVVEGRYFFVGAVYFWLLCCHETLFLYNSVVALAACRVLSISYDSVKKARYRLRQRLGLGRGDSLEDILRRFSE